MRFTVTKMGFQVVKHSFEGKDIEEAKKIAPKIAHFRRVFTGYGDNNYLILEQENSNTSYEYSNRSGAYKWVEK